MRYFCSYERGGFSCGLFSRVITKYSLQVLSLTNPCQNEALDAEYYESDDEVAGDTMNDYEDEEFGERKTYDEESYEEVDNTTPDESSTYPAYHETKVSFYLSSRIFCIYNYVVHRQNSSKEGARTL
jgi:hypothetical protein